MVEKEKTKLVGPRYFERNIKNWKTGRTPCSGFDSLAPGYSHNPETIYINPTDVSADQKEEDPF